MNEQEKLEIIQYIFENNHFKMLLKEEITKVKIQEIYTEKEKQFTSDIMNEISDTLATLIKFTVKQSLNQECTMFLQQNIKQYKDIEELKEKISNISVKFQTELSSPKNKIKAVKKQQSEKITKDFDISEQSSQSSNQKQGEENFHVVKLRKQIDQIKIQLQKSSTNSILQFVEQNNEGIHKKIEDKYIKLNTQIRQILGRNSDAQLQKSINSIMDTKYETLEHKIENFQEGNKYVMQKFDKFEKEFNRRFESGLKSIWNVITNIENTIESSRKIENITHHQQKRQQKKEEKKGFNFFWK